jgi:hypothetical protein
MDINNCIILQFQIIRTRHLSEILLEFIPKIGICSSTKSVVSARRREMGAVEEFGTEEGGCGR